MNVAAYIVAVVLFLLAALVAPIGGQSAIDLIAFGLAAFALAHVLPR